jgi:hypothetical protein
MVDLTLSETYAVAVKRTVPGQARPDGEGRPQPSDPRMPDELVSQEVKVEITEPPTPSR